MISKHCVSIVWLSLVVGCSAPVMQESEQTFPEKTELDGIWVGSFDIRGRGPYDFFAIHVGEKSTAVSHKANAMCVGQVSQDGEHYYSKYNLYALDGSPFDYARLTGEIKNGTIISYFKTLNGGDTGRLVISYSDIYEQPSSLELLEGAWSFTDRDGLVFDLTIENGEIQGKDSDDCLYKGQVSLINPNYNAYDIEINISNCSSVDGVYEGLSYLDTHESTILRVDIGNENYGFHYDWKKETII